MNDFQGQQTLIAYWIPSDKETPKVEELRVYLKKVLPDYMVPSHFVLMETIPLTPNGKVDRQKLPQIEYCIEKSQKSVLPNTDIEEEIAKIWSEALGHKAISVDESFFDLGGHSLLALQVIHRLESRFGITLSIAEFFELQTVLAISKRIETHHGVGTTMEYIKTISRKGTLPLSFSQERIWLAQQLNPGTGIFNMPGAVRLIGLLNIGALEEGLQRILMRHEVLRTRYEMKDGQLGQIITEKAELPLRKIDLRQWPKEQRELKVQQFISEEGKFPFDLSKDLLIRTSLIQMDQDEHILMLNMHHICSDGWSLNIFFEDLRQFYEKYEENNLTSYPVLPVQYVDYAYWQRHRLENGTFDEHRKYWLHKLKAPLPLLKLVSRKQNSEQSFAGKSIQFTLSNSVSEGLKKTAQKYDVTVFMLLMAGYKLLLGYFSNSKNIIVGTPVANRNHAVIEPLIGCFINLIALKTDLSGDPDLLEILERVKMTMLSAYAHQEMPFDQLLSELKPERTPGYTPIFQVMFTYHNTQKAFGVVNGLKMEPILFDNEYVKYDLLLNISDETEGHSGWLTYNTDLFNFNFAKKFVDTYLMVLNLLVTEIEINMSKVFEAIAEYERHEHMLETINRKESMHSKFKSIIKRF
jgi:acyl carrier protein